MGTYGTRPDLGIDRRGDLALHLEEDAAGRGAHLWDDR
jgi:hypothetical protein